MNKGIRESNEFNELCITNCKNAERTPANFIQWQYFLQKY